MKTLLHVYYRPRINSRTAVLSQLVKEITKDRFEYIGRDLVEKPPQQLIFDNLNAYYKRSYLKQELDSNELESVRIMDKEANLLKNADVLVLSYPIYNFGMPGVVKNWIDLVIQEGTAFTEGTYGGEGKYGDKKVLILNTSGASQKDSPSDFSTPHIKRIFSYVGVRDIVVDGLYGIKYTGIVDEKMDSFRSRISQQLQDWSGVDA